MLFAFLVALIQSVSTSAVPVEPAMLSIPVRDIVRRDLSAHEAHPNFELYVRWLETPQGSYVRRDPEAAFAKHSNIVTIDCRSDLDDCLLTSRLSFSDITNSKKDLEALNRVLEEQLRVRDEEGPGSAVIRALEKRAGLADTLYSSVHIKTYHNLGEDNSAAGFQHYIAWDLKCQTLQYSSSGFQLTTKEVKVSKSNDITAQLHATLVGDTDPEFTHSVLISVSFACALFGNRCCIQTSFTQNYVGGKEVLAPKTEPIECFKARDVSNENCQEAHGGWCGVHITQYQKNEGPGINIENYRFDVLLYDNDQELVGEGELISIPSGQTQQIGSVLPFTFGVTAPNLDDDAVYMSYNGQSWGSNDQEHHCDFGKYDSGHRDGDCGFSC